MKKYHYEENKDIDAGKTPDWRGLKLSLGLVFNMK